jgi:citrate lyase subunit beta / citryl-CoA lyase
VRTWLFVPGDNPPRIPKAFAAGADVAVVDLEDAVAPSRKAAARAGTVEALSGEPPGCRVGVRLNALASGLLEDDVAALRPVWERIDVLLLPMTADAATVRGACAVLDQVDGGEGPRLLPLVETAGGVLAAPEIAAADPRVLTLALGPADLSAELGIGLTPEGLELLHVRSQLVLAAAAAGRSGPVDGPWLDVADDEGLARSAATARSLGFSGKLAIHPRQLPAVRSAFAPTEEQLAWARAVDAAFGEAEARGVSSIRLPDGTFVDPPVAARARALLAEAAPER